MENNEIMEQPENSQVEVADANISENQDLLDENIEKSATDVEKNGSIGKFKDAETLISSYNNLQAEFTRKSQRLAELEKEQADNANTSNLAFENESEILDYINKNENLKNSFFKGYFEQLRKTASPVVINSYDGSGIPVNAPPKPKTLDEARDVVKKLFK